MVVEDVREGYVSLKKAKEEYGVMLHPKTLKVDMKGTRRLRENLSKVKVQVKVKAKVQSKAKAKNKAKGKVKGKGKVRR
jgi:hypothetical protein